jgi:hypothetical protein
MRFQFEPLGTWTGPEVYDRPYCRFRSSYADTIDLLTRETDKLGATLVVIQIDLTRAEIRNDGLPRASARPRHPGIRVSFASTFGPLTYATDRFDDWQDNLRAVALSLEALRAVDRYGVNQSGEQYVGFRAIEAGPSLDVAAATALIESYGGGVKEALFATHPDHGGSSDAFIAVQRARDVLAGASS